mmetsp:Transcript_23961/g.32104  ORF Transcript_23961/g.32104 Transcript_23961/m.32104 type:complete len:321 (-) Transcript_23961:106-1068(-)|eukprot:CAMPEP_0185589152 /NCGR_PEP_ID=MMETSP0434-20130131/55806_1 /TAXON_ID=626734 ORGANISM="Favella taraikaensis, Strain Fe Narragansett Bay" /NCGR_SAMPLE_ID=MMETSP0434 /ASSEMBLY_ACC=CAM_ASM_000379 /LENGTH=320 /DNA_ID=CAMNT_0028212311 /DNA_START=68 /DNA_END=1030 /DNA_ORIENTATION=-
MFKRLLCVAAVAACLVTSDAACAGNCNQKGSCGAHDRCECFPAYSGSKDCKQRVCPSGRSWNAGATQNTYVTCSARGTCNTEDGKCECEEGYTGHACQRTTCPQNCNGNGQCVTLFQHDSTYAGWDAHMTQACKCDPGYAGSACTERMCPRGDDMLSTGQVDEVHKCTISGTSMTGKFIVSFTAPNGKKLQTWGLNVATVTPLEIEEALTGLADSVIPSITTSVASASDSSTIFRVTFSDKENSGVQNLLDVTTGDFSASGNQPSFSTTGVSSASCERETSGTEESDVCSGRGNCDKETGQCKCYDGYTGKSCSSQTSLR